MGRRGGDADAAGRRGDGRARAARGRGVSGLSGRRRRWSPAPRTASAPRSRRCSRAEGARCTRSTSSRRGPDVEPLDVTDPAAVAAFVERVGAVDVLVNNAGGVRGQTGQPLEEVTDDDWRAVVDANLTSTFVCTRAVVPGMKARGWGRIVNISSGAGRSVSLTGIQAYASAKAGQIGLTRQTAHELGPVRDHGQLRRARASCSPTRAPSGSGRATGPRARRRWSPASPCAGSGPATTSPTAVRFFTAEASSWVTGQTIAVDGGHGIF